MTHPITPPPELVEQWCAEFFGYISDLNQSERYIATQAARWAADQELEACVEWLGKTQWCEPGGKCLSDLRAARRPKPPSLKEQALAALAAAEGADHPVVATVLTADQHATIRRALESLPDD